MTYKIVIDHREEHKNSIEKNIIKKFDEKCIEYEKKQLNVGDYIVINEDTGLKFCVERKLFSDLVGSIYNKRLFSELYKMNESYSKNFLIVVGTPTDFYKERAGLKKRGFVKKVRAFSKPQLYGIMATVAARYMNVEMIFVDNDDDFIDFLIKIADKLTDGKSIKGMSIIKAKSQENMYRNVLMAIPGISEDKAKKIEAEYPSFSELRAALASDSFKMEGFGPISVERFKKVLVL